MKYSINIEERLVKRMPINADNTKDVLDFLDKVKESYQNEEIVLTADDFEEVKFSITMYNDNENEEMEYEDVY